jgi:hypothetical protein
MKLQHFSKTPEGSSRRIQEIGKAMVSEVKLIEIKKPSKKTSSSKVEQDMRDYAVDQLAGSECHSAHHKIKHYD